MAWRKIPAPEIWLIQPSSRSHNKQVAIITDEYVSGSGAPPREYRGYRYNAGRNTWTRKTGISRAMLFVPVASLDLRARSAGVALPVRTDRVVPGDFRRLD